MFIGGEQRTAVPFLCQHGPEQLVFILERRHLPQTVAVVKCMILRKAHLRLPGSRHARPAEIGQRFTVFFGQARRSGCADFIGKAQKRRVCANAQTHGQRIAAAEGAAQCDLLNHIVQKPAFFHLQMIRRGGNTLAVDFEHRPRKRDFCLRFTQRIDQRGVFAGV